MSKELKKVFIKMKNIIKLSLALCLMSAGVYSCTEANAKIQKKEILTLFQMYMRFSSKK